MSELERLGVETQSPRSVEGVGMTRTEMANYDALSNPMGLIDNAVQTDGYASMNDNEKKLSLQLIVDQFQEDAETEVFNTQNETFRDLRQRIRGKN